MGWDEIDKDDVIDFGHFKIFTVITSFVGRARDIASITKYSTLTQFNVWCWWCWCRAAIFVVVISNQWPENRCIEPKSFASTIQKEACVFMHIYERCTLRIFLKCILLFAKYIIYFTLVVFVSVYIGKKNSNIWAYVDNIRVWQYTNISLITKLQAIQLAKHWLGKYYYTDDKMVTI